MVFIIVVPGARATKTLYFLFDGEAMYVSLQFSLSTNGPVCQMKAHFFMDLRTLFNMFWTVQPKHPLTANDNA